jgi:protease-4
MQLSIEHGYRRFLDVVAKARNMPVDEVDAVARGRVWTGEAASGLGLVDKLGGLEDAIAAAAARARLDDYEVVWPSAVESFEQRLLRRLLRTGEDLGLDLATGGLAAGPVAALLGEVERSSAELLRWNDPRHLYLHCLCETP